MNGISSTRRSLSTRPGYRRNDPLTDAEGFDQSEKILFMKAEGFRRGRAAAARFGERIHDQIAARSFHRFTIPLRRSPFCPDSKPGGQIGDRNVRTRTEHHRALDDI